MVLWTLLAMLSWGNSGTRLCEEMSSFTCLSVRVDDGTGYVDPSKNWLQKAQDFYYSQSEKLREFFQQNLNDPKDSADYEFYVTHFDLQKDLPCYDRKDEKNKKACDQQMANILLQLVNPFTEESDKKALVFESSKRLKPEGKEELYQKLVAHSKTTILAEEVKKLLAEENRKNPALLQIKENTFPKMKELLITRVKQFNLPPYQEMILTKRIKSMNWGDSKCAKYNDFLRQNFASDIYWDEKANELQVCPGFVIGRTSQFAIGFAVAKEIAQTISPHQWAKRTDASLVKQNKIAQIESVYPLEDLPDCLRLNSSVAAKEATPMLVQDQLSVATSDWWAAEVIASYVDQLPEKDKQKIKFDLGYSNILRGQDCSQNKLFTESIPTDLRVNALLRVQPQIRQHLACQPIQRTEKQQYCPGIKSTLTTAEEATEINDRSPASAIDPQESPIFVSAPTMERAKVRWHGDDFSLEDTLEKNYPTRAERTFDDY